MHRLLKIVWNCFLLSTNVIFFYAFARGLLRLKTHLVKRFAIVPNGIRFRLFVPQFAGAYTEVARVLLFLRKVEFCVWKFLIGKSAPPRLGLRD